MFSDNEDEFNTSDFGWFWEGEHMSLGLYLFIKAGSRLYWQEKGVEVGGGGGSNIKNWKIDMYNIGARAILIWIKWFCRNLHKVH